MSKKIEDKSKNSSLDEMVIFGCGGHARSIINAIRSYNQDIEIILVDKNARVDEQILGCNVYPSYEIKDNTGYIIGVGDNSERKLIYDELNALKKGILKSIISKDAQIGLNVEIGLGTFVASNAFIGPEAQIGKNVIINTASIIEHEVVIGDHSHVAPNATICGRSTIGSNVFCGSGSVIIDSVNVCNDVTIGAGAVVIQNIYIPGVYVGVPAVRIP